MDMNSIMASQLRSLRSAVQMSVLNNTLQMRKAATTEMLESLPIGQTDAVHPHKGSSIDLKV